MNIAIHEINSTRIAEIISDRLIINSAADGTDLVGNLYYQDTDKVMIDATFITPAFFDLSTGIAGEILQKFSNYRMRLAIFGDLSSYTGKSIRDFMFESNKRGQINFVASRDEAIRVLAEGA
jgi:hypothetical protein